MQGAPPTRIFDSGATVYLVSAYVYS